MVAGGCGHRSVLHGGTEESAVDRLRRAMRIAASRLTATPQDTPGDLGRERRGLLYLLDNLRGTATEGQAYARVTLEELNAIEGRAQLPHQTQRTSACQNFADDFGTVWEVPVEAGSVGLVHNKTRMRREQVASGLERTTELASHNPQLLPATDEIEHLTAHHEIEAAREEDPWSGQGAQSGYSPGSHSAEQLARAQYGRCQRPRGYRHEAQAAP